MQIDLLKSKKTLQKSARQENRPAFVYVSIQKAQLLQKSLLFIFAFGIGQSIQAQDAHAIQITLKPYQNAKIYLGYHYGKQKGLIDSAILDAKSSGVFAGKEKLPGGIYFIVSPKKEILFELLVDKEQKFSISADTVHIPASVVFTGSPDNTVFQSYRATMAKDGKEMADLQASLSTAKNHADSTAILDKMKTLNTAVREYRAGLEKKYPESLLTMLLKALNEPVVPPADQQPGGKYDSSFAYYFYRTHYWDGVSWTDDRLVRTPILEPKLDRYFRDIVPQMTDTINREVDLILLQSRTNKEMFKFLMVYFVQKYINPEYMGQDAVFVHLFEKFINTGQADFFTDKYRKFVDDRAYSLMANQIGLAAPDMEMTDSAGKSGSLYSVQSKFIVICFWDPTCSHCKEEVPKLDSIYQAKWKNEGVKMYGVKVDGSREAWLKFITDHNLKDWIHVYQPKSVMDADVAAGRPGYKQLYDVYQTPILYLLDADKHIIAKKLNYLQFDEVIDLKLKNPKSK